MSVCSFAPIEVVGVSQLRVTLGATRTLGALHIDWEAVLQFLDFRAPVPSSPCCSSPQNMPPLGSSRGLPHVSLACVSVQQELNPGLPGLQLPASFPSESSAESDCCAGSLLGLEAGGGVSNKALQLAVLTPSVSAKSTALLRLVPRPGEKGSPVSLLQHCCHLLCSRQDFVFMLGGLSFF